MSNVNANSIVASVYSGVIRDVIEKVKKDFDDSGVEESVLKELERIWEYKIRSSKVAPWEASGLSASGLSANGPVNGLSMNGLPTNGLPTNMNGIPANVPVSGLPQPAFEDQNGGSSNAYPQALDPNMKFSQSQYGVASLPNRAIATSQNNEVGRHIIKNGNNGLPAQAPPHSSSLPVSSDISNRTTPIHSQVDATRSGLPSVDQKIYHNNQIMGGQQDIEYSEKLSLVPREDSSPLPEFNTQMESLDNDDINSDLDDPDDDDNTADGEETQNIILCLYDKVTRTKNKWKCQLKDGIMSVNGRDYLFQKGNGDFEF